MWGRVGFWRYWRVLVEGRWGWRLEEKIGGLEMEIGGRRLEMWNTEDGSGRRDCGVSAYTAPKQYSIGR
ncbi:hypothetical protein B0H34DRAFT_680629 [Crassisporium funariophilum]|nr:hypothetical protein B0H34DRAFT_680629 [Crassisporium funariophilum]